MKWPFEKRRKKSDKRAGRPAKSRPLGIESLEERRVMATASLFNGSLFVYGTDQAETIQVRQLDGRLSVDGTQISLTAGGGQVASVGLAQVQKVVVYGQGGNDTIKLNGINSRAITLPTEIHGGAGRDTIYGGQGPDRIFGEADIDTIYGNYGDDLLDGGLGNDKLYGNNGNDLIFGDAGRDTLDGGNDDDQLFGGSDSDTLFGGYGSDWLDGGAGKDSLDGFKGNDFLYDDAVGNVIRDRTAQVTAGHLMPLGWFDMNLSDAAVRSAARAAFADPAPATMSLDRGDMLRLFSTVQGDNLVDATELADLRLIVANGAMMNMPDHVQVLSDHVLNFDPANASYQGGALGNLFAGSSGGQLSNLVNKWFRGTDHPVATGYEYHEAQGNLFVGGLWHTDIKQGAAADCYFMASLAEAARFDPSAVSNMIIVNGDGTYTVRFYYNNGTTLEADYVTVDRYLPTDANGILGFAGQGNNAANPYNELWVALVEKAYAQWNETGRSGQDRTNSYIGNGTMVPNRDGDGVTRISNGIDFGYSSLATTQITGGKTDWKEFSQTAEESFKAKFDQGSLITLATPGATYDAKFRPNHVFALTGYQMVGNTTVYRIYDPYQQEITATWKELQTNFTDWVYTAPLPQLWTLQIIHMFQAL